MNLETLYPNLPGMMVEFKDGGSSLRFEDIDASTDSILLLGTSLDGPVMEPIALDIDSVELLLGSEVKNTGVSNGTTLVSAFKQAYNAGCRDIRVMRISGEKAVSTIGAAPSVETTTDRIDEDLSVIHGNDATQIVLSQDGVVSGTVKVFAKGTELTEGVSFNPTTKTVSIKQNTCDAGASIVVKYEYIESVEATPEVLTVPASKTIRLLKEPLTSSLIVEEADGTLVPSASYSVAGDTITFSATVEIGDVVTVNYDYSVVGVGTENGKGDDAFLTETSNQSILLKEIPSLNSLILYVDGARVLNTDSFVVDEENRMLSIKKEYFKKGQLISVSYYVTKEETIDRVINISSIFAGDVYNTGTVEVESITDSIDNILGVKVTITKPESKVGLSEGPQIYTSFDHPTFGELVDAINSNNSVYNAETETPDTLTTELLSSRSYFNGGDNGLNLNKVEMYNALSGERDANGYIIKQGAYQLLENYLVDFVVPLGVYADDVLPDRNQNFAYELALFCAVISHKNNSTNGVIATKPIKDTSLSGVQAHAKYLANMNNLYLMKDAVGKVIQDREGNPIDLGKFISVVSGPTPIFNHNIPSLREGSPSVFYAALNSTLLPQSAPTNKKLNGCTGLKYTFSNAQLDSIIGNRVVTFGTKHSRSGAGVQGVYVIDGPTAARPNSEYSRLTTSRVFKEVINHSREVADPYIGEPNTIEQRNALSAALSKRYDLLVERGVIRGYSMNLVATPIDEMLGQSKLELAIIPPQEMRKITTIVGLKR